ncbi:hypothetical protein BASA83_012929 [Batrachochytrium salamandrivorans]|nr:hypothetical protein BASA83_012929 [Batrachochytrium salamandrivorans]
MDDHALTTLSAPTPELRTEISFEEAVNAAVDCLKVPFYPDIAPVKESYKTDNGDILVWKLQLRDEPMTRWFEVKKRKTFGTSTRGIFDVVFDPISPPQTPENLVAGAANAFYVTNMVHDVFYQHGFNEPAGNFQRDNFKRGGIDGDSIIINVQGSKEKNAASFDTFPDGHPGVLVLYLFTVTKPNRDSALDNTIIIHELAHGLSTRLTGGAHENLCMAETESRGLSGGYSDIIDLIFTAKAEDTRNTIKVIAEYAEGNSRGMRKYPYTTDMKVNPLKYQDAVGEKDPYHLGEIWAVMLWEVCWNFVEAYGFSANLHDATQKEARKAIQIGILVDTHPFSVDHCILCDQQLLSTSIAHLVVECEQVTGHRIQSGLVPAIQKSRLRLLGRALDPGVENVYTWLRGGVLNGEADLDQRWLDGTVEHESMGTRHDNRALAARVS